MSELIRETFIHLHSQDLVGELREEVSQLSQYGIWQSLTVSAQFIQRYGNHLIPVKYARTINKATVLRRAKEDTRRAQIAEALASNDEETAGKALSEAAEAARAAVDTAQKAVSTAAEKYALSEEDVDDSVPEMEDDITKTLGEEDVDEIVKKRASEFGYPTEKIGGQTFVRLRDMIPVCPPKGAFDVSKIKESRYFFS